MDSDGYDSQPDGDDRSTITDESDPSSDGESKYSSSASFVCDSDAEGDGDPVHHTPGKHRRWRMFDGATLLRRYLEADPHRRSSVRSATALADNLG